MMRFKLLAAALVTTAVLAGCGAASPFSQTPSAPSGSSAGSQTQQPEATPFPSASPSGTGQHSGGISLGSAGPSVERSVKAAYTVPSGAFLTSFKSVMADAVALGGSVVSSSTQPDAHDRVVTGDVTLEVPTAKVADFLNGLPNSFTASSIDFNSVDHSSNFVDADAQVASIRAHRDALNKLLADATSLSDIESLQQQIASVQGDLNKGEGQLNRLNTLINFSTVVVHLAERGAAPAPITAPLTSAVTQGWSNAIQVVSAALEVLLTMLPFVVALALVWLAWLWVRRKAITRRVPLPPALQPPA
jgi:hypothetical protein